jgi:hypothetical protein
VYKNNCVIILLVPIKTYAFFYLTFHHIPRITKLLTFVFFCLYINRTLGSDDYNDVRLGGHGTLHGYSNCINPFLEVSFIFHIIKSIYIFL